MRSSAAALDRGRSGFDIVVAEHGQQDARSRLFLWHVNSSEARKFAAKHRFCAEFVGNGNPMLYVRSVLVGIATGLVTIVISMIVWMFIAAHQLHRQLPHAEIAFDVHSMFARPSIVWLIGLFAFLGGFYWNLRRQSQ